jgi:hypothetical protein
MGSQAMDLKQDQEVHNLIAQLSEEMQISLAVSTDSLVTLQELAFCSSEQYSELLRQIFMCMNPNPALSPITPPKAQGINDLIAQLSPDIQSAVECSNNRVTVMKDLIDAKLERKNNLWDKDLNLLCQILSMTPNPVSSPIIPLTIREQMILKVQGIIYQRTTDGKNTVQQDVVQQFKDILVKLRSVQNNSDVHVLDPYVFIQDKKIKDLAAFGGLLQVDNGGLSLAQVGQQMTQFITDHPQEFVNFKYLDQLVDLDILKKSIDTFSIMDAAINTQYPDCSAAIREVWSRLWSLANNLYACEKDFSFLKIAFEQACEGHLTGGPCMEGRITRGFVGYVSLLTKYINENTMS